MSQNKGKNKGVGVIVVLACVYVGAAAAIVMVQRAASQPDYGRGLKMRGCRAVQGVAYRQATWWGTLGLRAESMYGRVRGI